MASQLNAEIAAQAADGERAMFIRELLALMAAHSMDVADTRWALELIEAKGQSIGMAQHERLVAEAKS